MIPAGDLIRLACREAVELGEVDSQGRPLVEYVALQALGRPDLLYRECRGLEEQIERWWRAQSK